MPLKRRNSSYTATLAGTQATYAEHMQRRHTRKTQGTRQCIPFLSESKRKKKNRARSFDRALTKAFLLFRRTPSLADGEPAVNNQAQKRQKAPARWRLFSSAYLRHLSRAFARCLLFLVYPEKIGRGISSFRDVTYRQHSGWHSSCEKH